MQQRHHEFRSSRIPKTGVVLALSVFASAALGFGTQGIVQTQTTGSEPIDVAESTVAFQDGNDVLVDDPAIASQGDAAGPRTVKEFTQDNPFSMFALTWQGQRDIAAFVRAQREDGTWGPWYEAEPETEEQSASGINGTELIYVEPTRKVQVSTSGIELITTPESEDSKAGGSHGATSSEGVSGLSSAVSGFSTNPRKAPLSTEAPAGKKQAEATKQAEPTQQKHSGTEQKAGASSSKKAPSTTAPSSEAPVAVDYEDIKPVAEVTSAADINAVMIDGNAQEEIIPQAETITSGMPPVVSRASWGANESWRCSSPTINDHNSAVVVHHTAGSNNYSQAEAAAQVRGIYLYHAKTLGWCDIGYNALVDKWGTIYEGRAGGLDKNVQGAHAGGFNENTWGISMIGNYVSETPSPETIKAVGDMAGWRAAIDGFDPLGSADHISEGTHYAKYLAGAVVDLPNIFAHRDVGLTTCPGDAGYAKMDDIRAEAKKKYDELMNSGNFPQGGRGSGASTKTTSPSASATVTPSAEIGTAASQPNSTAASAGIGTQAKGTAAKGTTSAKNSAKTSEKASAKVSAEPTATSTPRKKAPKASATTTPKAPKTTVNKDKTVPTSKAQEASEESAPEVTTEPTATSTPETTAESEQESESESTDPQTTDITVTLPTPTFSPAPEPTGQPTATTTVRVPSSEGVVPVEIESGSVVDQIIQALQNNDEESLGDRINTLAGIVYKYLVDKGVIEEPLEITINDIPVNPKLKALTEDDANELAEAWKESGGAAGELGQSRSGVQSAMTYDGRVINYAVFDHGLIVNTEDTGTQILPEEVALAWAKQGFDLGELGLPVSNPKYKGSTVTVNFQNGKVSFNTKTKKVTVTQN